MRNNQVAWYELQLMSKAGYNTPRFELLRKEALESHLSYEQVLEMEYQKLQRIRARVN